MRSRRVRFVLVPVVVATAVLGPVGWAAFGPVARAHIVQMSQLPSGVEIRPVGEKVQGDGPGQLPVAIAVAPDGTTAVTSDSGPSKSLTILDVATRTTRQRIALGGDALFNGLLWLDADTFLAAGGPSGQIYRYARGAGGAFARTAAWRAGVFIAALARDGDDVLATDQGAAALVVLDAATGTVRGTVPVGDHPQDVQVSADGATVWVSNWGARTVSVVTRVAPGVYVPAGAEANAAGTTGDVRDYAGPGGIVAGTVIDVGDHPSDLALSPDGSTLYVTNGNDDTISVIDTSTNKVSTTIDLAPYPGAPKSTAPQGIAISADGSTLYVANGGNSDVAVVDAEAGRVRGVIPAGWYPSAVTLAGDDLVVVNAKGDGPLFGYRTDCGCYSGGADPNGTVYVIPTTTVDGNLAAWTSDVMRYNRFDTRPGDIELPGDSGLGKVKKVVYIVRENKTFDQEFSDIEGADGDRALLRYGRDVTPNGHAMAEEWALLDNFYVNTETSIIGHQYSNAGQLSDYTQRTFGNTLLWSNSSTGRVPDEGIAEVSFPNSGYLVDNARRHGKDVRIYGLEGGRVGFGKDAVDKDVNDIDFAFPPGFDNGGYPDTLRAREFIRDVQRNGLADLSYLWLPADHTTAGIPGTYGPREQVASNDLATGMVLDFLSHSAWWKDSAMFVVEDDPQSGRDHVSPYRSLFMGASPHMKRTYRSSVHYSVDSVLRTIELALGLPAMSQNEHSAMPMLDLFTDRADYRTYDVRTAPLPPAFNPPVGRYADRSLALNFSVVDQDEEEIAALLEDMVHRNPVRTIPIDDRFGETAHEKWVTVMNHDGPLSALMPAAARPSARVEKAVAAAQEKHRTAAPRPADETAELYEWAAEAREELFEGAWTTGVFAGIVAAAALGAFALARRRRAPGG